MLRRLFRARATLDLILTKMMRGPDPENMQDVRFYLERESAIGVDDLRVAFVATAGPAIPEIRQLFAAARPVVLAMAQDARRSTVKRGSWLLLDLNTKSHVVNRAATSPRATFQRNFQQSALFR